MRHPQAISLLLVFCHVLVVPLGSWAQDYTTTTVTSGGTIAGNVIYASAATTRQPVVVDEDVEVCGKTPKLSADLIVNAENRGIQNVVVSITNISKGKAWSLPEEELAISQQGCWFNPHVLIMPSGRSIDVLNTDGILHNFHTRGKKNRPVNKAQPKFLKTLKVKFARADLVRVTCDVHKWMNAWIVVADHPYYALSDEAGAFQMENVPPGNYVVEFWHETLGKQTQTVTVAAGKSTQVDVTLSGSQ